MPKPPFYKQPGSGPWHPAEINSLSQLARGQASQRTTVNQQPQTPSAPQGQVTYTVRLPLVLTGTVFSIPLASATGDGYLSASDWVAFNGKEPALGNPGVSGYVLSSTTGGVRSWVAMSGGGSGTAAVTPFIFNAPSLGSWAWADQNAGSNGTSTRGFYIYDPAHTGWNLAAMHIAAPSTPYTAEFAIQPTLYPGNYNLFGVGWYNSGTGKYSLWEWYFNGGATSVSGNEFTNSTTRSSGFGTPVSSSWNTQSIIYIRIDFDGTTFRLLISQTGEFWILLGAVANTGVIGANPDICICASANANTFPVQLELLHYKTYNMLNPPANV